MSLLPRRISLSSSPRGTRRVSFGGREYPHNNNNNNNKGHVAVCSPMMRRLKACLHGQVEINTTDGQQVVDITQNILDALESWQPMAKDGILTVSSMHTTCAVVVNENECYLKEDILDYVNHVVPKDGPHGKGYGHNMLEKRPATERDREAIVRNNYGGFSSVEEFMSQEPVNAHAHIQSMLLGNAVTVGVEDASLRLGSWQSIMFVELDGPRENRKAAITLVY